MACSPVNVDIDISEFRKLPLLGKNKVTGTLTREIRWKGAVAHKGANVLISETYLARSAGKTPTGYIITGDYDPAGTTTTFELPDGAVEVYSLAYILPERRIKVLAPRAHIRVSTSP